MTTTEGQDPHGETNSLLHPDPHRQPGNDLTISLWTSYPWRPVSPALPQHCPLCSHVCSCLEENTAPSESSRTHKPEAEGPTKRACATFPPTAGPGLQDGREVRGLEALPAHGEEARVEDGRGEADVRPHAGAGVDGAEAGEEEASSPGAYCHRKPARRSSFRATEA